MNYSRNIKISAKLRFALIMAVTTVWPAPGMSETVALADTSPVTLSSEPIMLDKTVTIDGQQTHHIVNPVVSHDKVVPGSHLLVVTDYHNVSTKTLDHFVVTNPLPAALRLADDGFGDFEVSIDGGKSFGKLAALTRIGRGGSRRAAEASDVTTLRWIIPHIDPNASGKLEYHAIVR